jgi:translation elongation factor EF-G
MTKPWNQTAAAVTPLFCRGCIDLVNMSAMVWPKDGKGGCGDDGRSYDSFCIAETHADGAGMTPLPEDRWAASASSRAVVSKNAVAQALRMRQALCNSIADIATADGDDGGLQDACLSGDGTLSPVLLASSLRRSCIKRECMPVLLGAALRNRGMQPLLDAVVDFLPPPPAPVSSSPSPETVALAFKTIFDVKMGQELTYIRVYSGVVIPKQTLYISGSSGDAGAERVSSIFRISADEVQPLEQVDRLETDHCIHLIIHIFPPAFCRRHWGRNWLQNRAHGRHVEQQSKKHPTQRAACATLRVWSSFGAIFKC